MRRRRQTRTPDRRRTGARRRSGRRERRRLGHREPGDSSLELRTDRLLEELEADTVEDLSVVTADGEKLEVREVVDDEGKEWLWLEVPEESVIVEVMGTDLD
ncbi:hypothetical protein C491_03620 [Natronococcus amylolyticus DSM 10524]|uniref:Uncharacterized protein n=1 Tax=Natronococcus amylolyticus DSM 10524 TaxID=1227497 RepID=L9XFF4_9EURY|nr:hypothetical protein C491_03620 [Natronococcus amylolyticus DSM 10524]